jgi:hypothetical protein
MRGDRPEQRLGNLYKWLDLIAKRLYRMLPFNPSSKAVKIGEKSRFVDTQTEQLIAKLSLRGRWHKDLFDAPSFSKFCV